MALALRPGRPTLRADALKRSSAWLPNLAPCFPAEWAKPSVPQLLHGPDDFERHTLYLSDSVAIGVPLRFSGQEWANLR
jgi:hypothetical protein